MLTDEYIAPWIFDIWKPMLIGSGTRIRNENATSMAENMPHTCDPLVNAKFTGEDVDIEHVTHLRYKISPAIKDFWFPMARLEFQCGNACNISTSWNEQTSNPGYLSVDIVFSRNWFFAAYRYIIIFNEETLCHFFSLWEKQIYIGKQDDNMTIDIYSLFKFQQRSIFQDFLSILFDYYKHSSFYCLISNEFYTILISLYAMR